MTSLGTKGRVSRTRRNGARLTWPFWAEVADLVRADAGNPDWQLREAEPVAVHWFRLLEPAAAPTARPASR